ncbi:hypothetical protein EJ07DRAFT_158069 [Lizonia empirigonia]|nr:hypothetical protein EJ07DRAFT_158069 [Lizonia empirigonia]
MSPSGNTRSRGTALQSLTNPVVPSSFSASPPSLPTRRKKRTPIDMSPANLRQRLANSNRDSAIATPNYYKSLIRHKPLKKIENDSVEFSLKRGRERELLAENDYPGPQHPHEDSLELMLTEDQKPQIESDLIFDSNAPVEHDSRQAVPKRKCRRIDAEINFDRLVYTRTESDIDLLFQPTPEFSVVFSEDIEQATSAPKGNSSTSSQRIDLSPRRPYTVRRLIMEG